MVSYLVTAQVIRYQASLACTVQAKYLDVDLMPYVYRLDHYGEYLRGLETEWEGFRTLSIVTKAQPRLNPDQKVSEPRAPLHIIVI